MNMQWLDQGLEKISHLRHSEIIPADRVYEWQRNGPSLPERKRVPLSPEAQSYLRSDNPKLLDLQRRYSAFNLKATTPLLWEEGLLNGDDIPYFRGDNAYVWQVRGQTYSNVLAYALAFYYLKSIDRFNFLDRMTEDGAFGGFAFHIGDRDVSRDVLDSIAEIYFLERNLDVSNSTGLKIVDIGAGYGRLAHRANQAWPKLGNYLCTDAIASSSFISEFYLSYRAIGDKAKVVPLDEVEQTLGLAGINLAVNIHSFSECQLEAIDWWVGLIARSGIRHFMIVPNATDSGCRRLLTNDRKDFTPVLEKHGYRLLTAEPKFQDPFVQQYALYPATHFLFELA